MHFGKDMDCVVSINLLLFFSGIFFVGNNKWYSNTIFSTGVLMHKQHPGLMGWEMRFASMVFQILSEKANLYISQECKPILQHTVHAHKTFCTEQLYCWFLPESSSVAVVPLFTTGFALEHRIGIAGTLSTERRVGICSGGTAATEDLRWKVSRC